jgi:hypothetical protein
LDDQRLEAERKAHNEELRYLQVATEDEWQEWTAMHKAQFQERAEKGAEAEAYIDAHPGRFDPRMFHQHHYVEEEVNYVPSLDREVDTFVKKTPESKKPTASTQAPKQVPVSPDVKSMPVTQQPQPTPVKASQPIVQPQPSTFSQPQQPVKTLTPRQPPSKTQAQPTVTPTAPLPTSQPTLTPAQAPKLTPAPTAVKQPQTPITVIPTAPIPQTQQRPVKPIEAQIEPSKAPLPGLTPAAMAPGFFDRQK